MIQNWDNFVRFYKEMSGSRKSPLDYPFSESEIISQPTNIKIRFWERGHYLNLHPNLYAVMILDGKLKNLEGGYNSPIPPGRYRLYVVDKKKRLHVMEKVGDTTRDGANISLRVIITFQVSDPIKAFEIQQPLETLYSFIQADLKEFIRNHLHNEIIGTDQTQTTEGSVLAQYIKQQHLGRRHFSRVFTILEVAVESKQGDPNLTEIKIDYQRQQNQKLADTELQRLKQELEKQGAAKDAEIRKIRASTDVDVETIRRKMREQEIELENLRRNLKMPQEIMQHLLEVLSELGSNPSLLNSKEFFNTLREWRSDNAQNQDPTSTSTGSQKQSSDKASPDSANAPMERLDLLTRQLRNMIDRNKRQG